MANTININVLGDVRDLQRKLGTANNELGKLGKASSRAGSILKNSLKVAGVGALAAGLAIAKFSKDSITAASDLNETISKTKTIFGAASPEIMKFGRSAATALGMSQNEALTGLSTFGNFFNQIGIGTKKAAGMSKQFLTLSADMASFHNAAPVDVMDALASATRGEYDALQKYIPTINAAAVEQKALAMTGKDNAKALTTQDKALALHTLAMKGQGKAQGDFKRTSGSLANQQRILAAQFENVKAKVGKALLPVMQQLVTMANSTLMPALKRFAAWFQAEGPSAIDKVVAKFNEFLPTIKKVGTFLIENAGTILKLVAGFYALTAVLAAISPVVSVVVGLFKAYKAIAMAVQVVQLALNILWAANPIGLVVVAIAALVAVFVLAYKKSETFRRVVDKAWNAIKTATVTVWDFIKKHIKTVMIGILVAVTGPVGLLVLAVVKNWNKIKSATSAVWNGIKTVVSSVANGIKSVVTSVWNSIKSVVSSVWNAVKTATTNAWNGIKNAVSTAVNGLMTTVSGIKGRVLGAFAGAAGWLLSAGKNIIQGLLDGIGNMIGSVKSKLGELTDMIPNWKGPRSKDKKLLTPVGRLIMKSLIKGFDDGRAGIKSSLGKTTDLIEKFYDKTLSREKAALIKRMKAHKATSKEIAAAVSRLEKANKAKVKKSIKGLGDETKALMRNAKRREAIYKRLEKAQKRLADLQQASKDYAKSVKDSVLNYTNITGLGTAFNADAMIAGLKDRLEKVRQFAALIQQLVTSGLNQSMIDQLVQAGVEGGLATASAIAAGGPAAIAEFNALQQQINQAATGLGNTASGSMYDAGIQAAQGLIEGLKSQKKKFEKFARQLARDLVDAIKKALGIHSPSTVFREIGEYTVKGLEIGLKDVSGVKKGMTNLANAMTDGFSPRLATTATTGGMGGNTYNITVNAPVGVDSARTGKEIVSYIEAYERKGGRRRA